MTRLTEEQKAKGRKRFLAQNPDIQRKIDAITQAAADAIGMTLESLREHETMKALANYAHTHRRDSQELFFSCIADTAEEFAQMLEKRDQALKSASGL